MDSDKNWKCESCGLELYVPDGLPVHHACKSRGLGDTVAKVTKAFGVKPCGRCKKRQQKLNEMFPYKDKNNGE